MHEVYNPVKLVNGVYIDQTGGYGETIGNLDFEYADGKLSLVNGDDPICSINDEIPADEDYMRLIANYRRDINAFLEGTGYSLDTPVFESEVEMIRQPEMRNSYLTFVTSQLRNELNKHIADDADIYLLPGGLVRNNIELVNGQRTRYHFTDVFQILGIGFSDDFEPGYDVVTFYLSKEDVKKLIDLIDIYRSRDKLYTPAYSDSLEFSMRWWGIPFVNRIKDLKLNGIDYCDWPKYIKFGTNSKTAQGLQQMKDLTYGIFKFTFRDKNGDPIAQPEEVPTVKEYLMFADAMKGRVLTK
jgi:2',3'-cyclic-nucleotide 2'-phosphodiesterase (5'-nucleotidase family)